MICSKCNYQNEEVAKFCKNCGAELHAAILKPNSNSKTNQRQRPNFVVWVMSILFLLALGAFVFTWTQHKRERNELQTKLTETQSKLDSIQLEIKRKTDVGVVINGVRWATRNVSATPGTFVDNPEDLGYQYSLNKAENSCPDGWRLPNSEELYYLYNAKNTWTTINGIRGRLFGSDSNTVFLPADGSKQVPHIIYLGRDIGSYDESGLFISDESGLFISKEEVDLKGASDIRNYYLTGCVRCVRDKEIKESPKNTTKKTRVAEEPYKP